MAELDRLVAEIAARWPARPRPVWLPPLPERLEPVPGVLGRLDRPAAREQPALCWAPEDGPMCVVGGRRSGRTTALLNVVAAAARPPEELHVFGIDAGDGLAPLLALPHTGAVVAAQDRARLRRLLGRLAEPGPALDLLLVDGYDALAGWCDDGEGARLLDALDRLVRRPGLVLAVTSGRPHRLPPSLAAACAVRVTLRLDDPTDAALAGVPPHRDLPPGRGWVDGDVVQLSLAPDLPTDWPRPDPRRAPPTIGELPADVRRADLSGDGVVVGLRDRDLRPATLPRPDRFVIAGPPGSGRSTALRLLAAQLDGFTVVDDAEDVELVDLGVPLLVAVRADAWRSAHGTWLADLRPCASGLALRPDVRDAELWLSALPSVGPAPPPGRGVLVVDGRADVVQVARP